MSELCIFHLFMGEFWPKIRSIFGSNIVRYLVKLKKISQFLSKFQKNKKIIRVICLLKNGLYRLIDKKQMCGLEEKKTDQAEALLGALYLHILPKKSC